MKVKPLLLLVCVLLTLGSVNVRASDTLRFNPFEQPDMTVEATTNSHQTTRIQMKLRGTVIDGYDSLVNINGEFYRMNQEVAGYRVTEINNSSVTLSRGDSEMVLTLNGDE